MSGLILFLKEEIDIIFKWILLKKSVKYFMIISDVACDLYSWLMIYYILYAHMFISSNYYYLIHICFLMLNFCNCLLN